MDTVAAAEPVVTVAWHIWVADKTQVAPTPAAVVEYVGHIEAVKAGLVPYVCVHLENRIIIWKYDLH